MAAFAALPLLAGCAPTAVKLAYPGIDLPMAYETAPFDSPLLASSQEPARPIDSWWQDFNDPQLTGLIDRALARSTTARFAHARIAEARALRRRSHRETLPGDRMSAGYAAQGAEPVGSRPPRASSHDGFTANYDVSWEIDLFGRLSAIRDRADIEYQISALDYYATRLSLAAEVAETLFQARFLRVQLDNAQSSLRIARELTSLNVVGVEHGLVAESDSARLGAEAASLDAEVTRLTAELRNAKRSLLILTGDPFAPTDTFEIEPNLSAPPRPPAATPGLLLTRRPDVRAAELGLQSADKTLKIDRANLYPRFALQPGIGLITDGASLASGSFLWSLFAGATVPILDRGRLLAQLDADKARGAQAVVRFEESVQQAYGEAENALGSIAAHSRRIGQLEVAESESRRALEASRRARTAGLTNMMSVLEAERDFIRNRASLAAGRLALLTDTVKAFKALGGGWSSTVDLAVMPEVSSDQLTKNLLGSTKND